MTTPNPQPGIRIGTAEREAAMKALGEHLAAGRLEPDEYEERVSVASAARTREALDGLFEDLPAPHPFPPFGPHSAQSATPRWQASRPQRPWERYLPSSPAARVVAAVLAAVLLVSALPFVAAGALLWFVVLPALSCSGPWQRRRVRGPVGRPMRW